MNDKLLLLLQMEQFITFHFNHIELTPLEKELINLFNKKSKELTNFDNWLTALTGLEYEIKER